MFDENQIVNAWICEHMEHMEHIFVMYEFRNANVR